MQSAHALINTSYKEGWGLVNLEANSQGTPAITFNVEGCKDSIKNGVNGFISETEEDFVKNILKIKGFIFFTMIFKFIKMKIIIEF